VRGEPAYDAIRFAEACFLFLHKNYSIDKSKSLLFINAITQLLKGGIQ